MSPIRPGWVNSWGVHRWVHARVGCHVGGRAIATSTANQARLSEAVASAGYCMLGSATICWVDGATSLIDPSWLSDLEVCTAEDLRTDVTGSFSFTLVIQLECRSTYGAEFSD